MSLETPDHATPTYMGVFARACLDIRRQDGRPLPLALWHERLASLTSCLLQPADDLFGGYHLVGQRSEVNQRRLVAVA